MTLGFLSHLLDVSIRSVFLAFVVVVMLWILRNNKSSSLAHAAWTVVLCGMLSIFALGPVLPPLPLHILSATPGHVSRLAPLITSPAPGVVLPSVPGAAASGNPSSRIALPTAAAPQLPAWQTALVFLYASVSLVFLGRLLTGWWLLRRLLAVSRIVHDADANDVASRFAPHRTPILYESPSITIPSTVGWRKPKILLPSEWRSWNDGKLNAVLAHEASHLRRRDSLVASLAALNRCLLWFHPLAWWMERKLELLAEQACDESCLCVIRDREGYACLLLEMASAVEASGGRTSWRALAMARPSHLRQRIEIILDETRIPSGGVTKVGWFGLLMYAIPVIYGSAAVRLQAQPELLTLQHRPFTPPAPILSTAFQIQQPAQSKQVPAAPTLEPTTIIPVTVTDPLNRFVTGLEREHFQVLDGTVELEVTGFFNVDGPLSVGLVLDTRGNLLSTSRQAAGQFLKVSSSQDEFFLVQLKDQPELTVPFTSDRNEIQNHLAAEKATGGTVLLDGLHLALEEMKRAKNARKALLILSGGAENGSRHTESEIRHLANAANVQIYALSGFEPNSSQTRLLAELAEGTGGISLAVDDLNELPPNAARLGVELRNTYLLGYRSTSRERSGQYRNVEVRLLQPRGLPILRARWRPGYYASVLR